MHKLIEPISTDTWKILTSRPIRGAEMDPMRTPSRALHGFLKEMLLGFNSKFPEPFQDQDISSTVLNGCDDYLSRLSKINLSREKFSMTTLISADFGDAYTETSIPKLKRSIRVIGKLLDYEDDQISLIENLVELVFANAYFYTPYGLYKQTRGMPMGDFSSRESLDIVLSNSEFDILRFMETLEINLKLFVRLVDDISIISQEDFAKTRDLIELMVQQYPEMPLNFQISFGYSRFLDLHIYNFMDDQINSTYKITHMLAYKENSSFCYTPQGSNIHHKYKAAVIPISLFRIHTRCNRTDDINHHLSFMTKIVKNRDQNPKVVHSKITKYFLKKKGLVTRKCSRHLDVKSTSITYDNVSKRHIFLKGLITKSFASRLRVVYKSRPKLLSLISPKRRVLRTLSRGTLFKNKILT